MKKEIDRFAATSEDGQRVTIVCRQTFVEHKNKKGEVDYLPAFKEFLTASGDAVNQDKSDPNTFHILNTDQVVRKI